MVDKIKNMVGQGFSARKIAQYVNLSFEEVTEIIKNNNFIIKKQNFDESKIDEIIDLYGKGVSAKNIGSIYNIDKRRVLKWAQNSGILRSVEESHRIHQVNEHIFDNISTQHQAYWLGFLYADAYNCETTNAIILTLKEDDKNHIIKFIEFVGGDVNHIKYNINELGNSWSYKINSKYLSIKLKELGCPQAKSFIITYPDWLNKQLNYHFIRGYFDGDGCLTFRQKQREYKWSLVGTEKFCNSIQNIFNLDNINIPFHYISKTNSNTYELETSGNLKIEKICDLLYKNVNIYLDRKYDKYLKLKEFNDCRRKRKFNTLIKINNVEMNNIFFKSLSIEERKKFIIPITDYFYNDGFVYPDDQEKVIREYRKLCETEIDLSNIEINNHSRLGTYICKYFCKSFYNSFSSDSVSVVNAYTKDNIEKAVIGKLGINTNIEPKTINFSPQTIIDELKDIRLAAQISIFKPVIAKYICLKYSNPGDVVGDYSCGFGGRLLGAISCNRKYIGTDPLTSIELQKMIEFFKFENATVLNIGSELYKGQENSIDLYWSSPPYYDLERYSKSLNQAYNKGEDYFYNIYWRNTLQNIKYMLKPDKWFGVNVTDKYFQMIEIAKEYFGEIKEETKLISYRYHFASNKVKKEKIFMFKNIK